MTDTNEPRILLKPTDTLVLATGNQGKLDEFRAALKSLPLKIVSIKDYVSDFAPVENADSFVGNARIKALAAAHATDLPSLADDSGFCIKGLGDRPGIYSARFLQECGSHAEAFERLQEELLAKARETGEPRSELTRAYFVAAFCLAMPDGRIWEGEEFCQGHFEYPPHGKEGHGYDPVFRPLGMDKTFAELSQSEKNALSHRGRLIERFVAEHIEPQHTEHGAEP